MSSSEELETKPSLLKTLLWKAGKSESTHTPFKDITAQVRIFIYSFILVV
jgi:hypothetical protein